ncbi:hypothetical protein [Mesorhizobium sp. f-mel]
MAFAPTPEMVDAVAEWHARRPDDRIRRALLPCLQARFGVTAVEGVEIIRAAGKSREASNADGS